MKHLPIILLVLCSISCQNKTSTPETASRVWLSPSNQYLDSTPVEPVAQEAATDTIDWDAEVDITRHWYPEGRVVHLFGQPSRQVVAKWKDACDRDTLHSVTNLELSRFAYGVRHLTAFYDLNNLTVDQSEEDGFILWRLAQFTGDSITPPTIGAKLELLLRQIELLLEFDAQFQVEHNMKAGMEGYLQYRFNRIAVREIAKERAAVARFIMLDYSFAEEYSKAYSIAFETVNYYDAMASSYPVTYGESETNDALMFRSAVNAWVYPDSTGLIGADSRYATINRVLAEYDNFMNSLEEDDEYYLPVLQRRAALRKERAAWKKWMEYRTKISPQLPEPLRSAFDHATRSICRRKLITLKNRYACFGYMSASFKDSLLPFDCTDEQIKTYKYPL